jgi:hypothetical protein
MNKMVAAAMAIAIGTTALFASEKGQSTLGINVSAGGRYDNLRMCVATPAGVKGGPAADIQLIFTKHLDNHRALGFKLPLMRPLLFGAAFKMVQFEPELSFGYRAPTNTKLAWIVEPSVGISLHYGPDYRADARDSDAERFFAAGPFLATFVGVGWTSEQQRLRSVGIKPFYTPLFSAERKPGTVLGAALEGHWDFGSIH